MPGMLWSTGGRDQYQTFTVRPGPVNFPAIETGTSTDMAEASTSAEKDNNDEVSESDSSASTILYTDQVSAPVVEVGSSSEPDDDDSDSESNASGANGTLSAAAPETSSSASVQKPVPETAKPSKPEAPPKPVQKAVTASTSSSSALSRSSEPISADELLEGDEAALVKPSSSGAWAGEYTSMPGVKKTPVRSKAVKQGAQLTPKRTQPSKQSKNNNTKKLKGLDSDDLDSSTSDEDNLSLHAIKRQVINSDKESGSSQSPGDGSDPESLSEAEVGAYRLRKRVVEPEEVTSDESLEESETEESTSWIQSTQSALSSDTDTDTDLPQVKLPLKRKQRDNVVWPSLKERLRNTKSTYKRINQLCDE